MNLNCKNKLAEFMLADEGINLCFKQFVDESPFTYI